jgi:hypothetical protein
MNPEIIVKLSVRTEDPNYVDLTTNIFDDHGGNYTIQPLTGQVGKYSFTTSKEGNVHVCITNTGAGFPKIFFEFLSGAEAGDLSGAASDKDLEPVERQLRKLDRLMNSVKRTTSFIVAKEDQKISEADSIPSKLYTFSLITLVVMSVVAFIQVKYMKNFFRSKKLI